MYKYIDREGQRLYVDNERNNSWLLSTHCPFLIMKVVIRELYKAGSSPSDMVIYWSVWEVGVNLKLKKGNQSAKSIDCPSLG